jgi:hypothetical protein
MKIQHSRIEHIAEYARHLKNWTGKDNDHNH